MVEETSKQSGSINIDAGGDVTAGGDLVGRDKIIHNIVVLGQFLDFAKVEGLLPKPSELEKFESITAAVEKAFGDRLESDLAEATAFAGKILGEAIAKWRPKGPSLPVLYRDLLPELAIHIVGKLKEVEYWEAVSGEEYIEVDAGLDHCKVLWLYSLQTLWKKYLRDDTLFGIADTRFFGSLFARQNKKGDLLERVDFNRMKNEGFRIFMAGLVIDLIRLYSIASSDSKFLDGLINLLAPHKE